LAHPPPDPGPSQPLPHPSRTSSLTVKPPAVVLGVDLGRHGCQIYDATTFLAIAPRFDTGIPLILLQLEVLGRSDFDRGVGSEKNLRLLEEMLLRHYPPGHVVTSYEAALFSGLEYTVTSFSVAEIEERAHGTMTLYIPEAADKPVDETMVARMALNAPSSVVEPDSEPC
ncbi:hypothetical protein, partial [Streptomyces vastus]|uniref:hypothetical protein n=1 Tax=Streptomyces vastus TaxID=285451 RepID=UPI0031E42781